MKADSDRERNYKEFNVLYERKYPGWIGPSISFPGCSEEEAEKGCGCWMCQLEELRREFA